VYSINYPLAPENPYPDPVISALRALAEIKRLSGADSVILMGDSAGGAVAATVAALVSSEGLCVTH
jgi:monoterpene epsilon-lactone hydrolase